MTDQPIRLVIEPPTSDSPGFLRRQYRALKLQARLQAGDVEAIPEMVAMLVPFVTEPTNPQAAEAALWDASQTQLMAALGALTGNAASQPEPSAVSSAAG